MTPSLRKRTVPMQALCLGMPKTGTVSMTAALNQLGLPCYNSYGLLRRPRDWALWNNAVAAKWSGKGEPFTRAQWDDLLGDFAATADSPMAYFWEELVLAYPEAKVVLTERNVDRWEKSMLEHLIPHFFWRSSRFILDVVEPLYGPLGGRAIYQNMMHYFRAQTRQELEQNLRRIYEKHYARIRAVVPAERILEYKLGDGWGPICKFLDRPVPAGDFPWLNDGEEMVKESQKLQAEMLATAGQGLLRYVLPLAVIVAAWYLVGHGYFNRASGMR